MTVELYLLCLLAPQHLLKTQSPISIVAHTRSTSRAFPFLLRPVLSVAESVIKTTSHCRFTSVVPPLAK